MVENPTDFIDPIARAGADFICPHAETINRDAFRVINQIRALGKKWGGVEPGYAGGVYPPLPSSAG